jgi:hypothetical protein
VREWGEKIIVTNVKIGSVREKERTKATGSGVFYSFCLSGAVAIRAEVAMQTTESDKQSKGPCPFFVCHCGRVAESSWRSGV